jgi:hypothetical protein
MPLYNKALLVVYLAEALGMYEHPNHYFAKEPLQKGMARYS